MTPRLRKIRRADCVPDLRQRLCTVKDKGAWLLPLILAVVLLGCHREPPSPSPASPSHALLQEIPSHSIPRTVEYEVLQTLTVVNKGPGQPRKHNIWVALIQDVLPYQTVRSMEISPDSYRFTTDEYGNRYAEFDLADMPPGTTIPIQIQYQVAVNEVIYDLSPCQGEVPNAFDQPELHIESSNPQLVDLAEQLSKGQRTACKQVRAFYDFVGDSLVYSYNGKNWGAQAALGPMGADCTEYASLMIALSRAAGIPARYLEGLRVVGEDLEEDARTEHAWLEVYLPGNGWTPMDPTLGRSSLSREKHFAHFTPDHIIVTTGRNPSTLRGASYWTHLYWPGNSTEIRIEDAGWTVTPVLAATAGFPESGGLDPSGREESTDFSR